MPTSTRPRTRRARVNTTDPAIVTGLHAPSNVNVRSTAADNAARLSQALGLGSVFVQDVQERRRQKAVLKGTEAALEGRALLPEEEENDAFMSAHAGITTNRSWTDFTRQIAEQLPVARQQEGFDANAWLDEQARLQFEGLDPDVDLDRETAGFLAPRLEDLRGKLLAEHQALTLDELKESAGADLGIIAENLRTAGPLSSEQWNSFNEQAFAAARSDPRYVDDVLSTIIERAVAAGDVETLQNLPERWDNNIPTLRSNPRTSVWFDSQLAAAQRNRQATIEQSNFVAVGVARANLQQLADEGSPDFMLALSQATTPDQQTGILVLETPEQVASMTSRWLNAVAETEGRQVDLSLFAQGNARGLTPAQKDAAAVAYVEALKSEGFEPDAIQAALIERSVVNNFVPAVLEQAFDVSPRNVEAYARAAELFTQFEAQEKGFLSRNGLTAEEVRNFETFNREVVRLGTPAAAAEALTSSDPDLITHIPSSALRETQDAIQDELADGPLWRTLVQDSPAIRQMIDAELRHYIGRGYGLEQAQQLATEALHPRNGRYVAVRHHLYKASAGWGQNPEDVATWAAERYATETGTDVSNILIEPIPGRPNRVRVLSRGNDFLPGGVTEYSIADLTAEYIAEAEAEQVAAATRGRAQARAEAEARLQRAESRRRRGGGQFGNNSLSGR